MKKLTILLIAFLVIAPEIFGQGSLGIFVGYGKSAFDKELFGGADYDQAGYIPVGAQLLMGVGMFQLGAEVNYAAVPFTFEMNNSAGTKLADFKITQLYFGAVAKLRIGSGAGMIPYARAGAGMYTGEAKIEFTDDAKQQDPTVEDASQKFKAAFGFNVGGGIEFAVAPNTGLFGEVVFHMVKREYDLDGAPSWTMNNMALHVGVNFGL